MRKASVCAVAILLGIVSMHGDSFAKVSPAALTTASAAAASAAQSTKKIYVPAGTRILVRTIDAIDSTKQKTGDRFTASLETNLVVDNIVVAPRGATVYGRLASASSSGRMSGSSELSLELTDIVIRGTAYPLLTSTYDIEGKGEGGNTTKKILGGAGLGALIGGIAGGGKGAGIGALAGAGAGTAVAASKKGEQLSIPSESLLEFRLQQPGSLPVSS
jgi:hypothetical protein